MTEENNKHYVIITVADSCGKYIAFNFGLDFDFKYTNTETYLNEYENITTTVYTEEDISEFYDFTQELLADDNARFIPELELSNSALI